MNEGVVVEETPPLSSFVEETPVPLKNKGVFGEQFESTVYVGGEEDEDEEEDEEEFGEEFEEDEDEEEEEEDEEEDDEEDEDEELDEEEDEEEEDYSELDEEEDEEEDEEIDEVGEDYSDLDGDEDENEEGEEFNFEFESTKVEEETNKVEENDELKIEPTVTIEVEEYNLTDVDNGMFDDNGIVEQLEKKVDSLDNIVEKTVANDTKLNNDLKEDVKDLDRESMPNNAIYEKGMSVKEFVRANKDLRTMSDLRKFYSMSEINSGIKYNQVFYSKKKDKFTL